MATVRQAAQGLTTQLAHMLNYPSAMPVNPGNGDQTATVIARPIARAIAIRQMATVAHVKTDLWATNATRVLLAKAFRADHAKISRHQQPLALDEQKNYPLLQP